VLGDAAYGVGSPALGRQALHAWKLAFPAPGTGHAVEVEAPVPADLQGALAALSVPGAGGHGPTGTVKGPATAWPPRRSRATTQTCT
jgi:hypothetical protein